MRQKPSKNNGTALPSSHEIAVCAYALWEAEDHPVGRDVEHWLQAEKQLMADRLHDNQALLAMSDKATVASRQPRRRASKKAEVAS